jgi:LEA14-like dessication related protein
LATSVTTTTRREADGVRNHAGGQGARAARLVAALLLAGAGTGCLAFQRPTLRVADVRLASIGLSGGTVGVTLSVDNPNDYALESEGFRYRLQFTDDAGGEGQWVTLADGRDDQRVSIPAGDTASVELDVPFEMAPLGTALGRLLRRGALEYRFTGELQVTGPRRVRVPFDQRGVFRP